MEGKMPFYNYSRSFFYLDHFHKDGKGKNKSWVSFLKVLVFTISNFPFNSETKSSTIWDFEYLSSEISTHFVFRCTWKINSNLEQCCNNRAFFIAQNMRRTTCMLFCDSLWNNLLAKLFYLLLWAFPLSQQ